MAYYYKQHNLSNIESKNNENQHPNHKWQISSHENLNFSNN